MGLENITKRRLLDAQNHGYTAIITKQDSSPLDPIWIFQKVKESELKHLSKKLDATYQLGYSISEAIKTIDEYAFIGKVSLPD